jgi:pilus assembly protein Flp/PilA
MPFLSSHPARLIARFARDEEGATAIEYALIAGVIALGLVFSLSMIGSTLRDHLESVGSAMTTS